MPTTHERLTLNNSILRKYWQPDEGFNTGLATPEYSVMNDFTFIQHTDGVWHTFGIKGATGDWPPGSPMIIYGKNLHHQTSTDRINWTPQDDIRPDELADPSFATLAWGEGPNTLWAPHVIVNPTKDTASTSHSERYVMALTAVLGSQAPINLWGVTKQLVVLGYSDDLYDWTWDTEAIYDPLNNDDNVAGGDAPLWIYQTSAEATADWRDPNFFYDPGDSKWYMSVSCLRARGDFVYVNWGAGETPQYQWYKCISSHTGDGADGQKPEVYELGVTDGDNTWWEYLGEATEAVMSHVDAWADEVFYDIYVGAIARLVWTGTTDFSAGWQVTTPGSETGCTFLEADAGTDIMEGTGLVHCPDSNGIDHYWIRFMDNFGVGIGGAGYRIAQWQNTDDLPWPRRNHLNVIGEWIRALPLGYTSDRSVDESFANAWGSGMELVATDTDGVYDVARFFSVSVEHSGLRELNLNFAVHHHGTLDFTQQDTDAGDNAPLLTWDLRLSLTEWPVQWGTAFANQPTFGDPKGAEVDTIIYDHIGSNYGRATHYCLSDHTAAAGKEPDGGDFVWANTQTGTPQYQYWRCIQSHTSVPIENSPEIFSAGVNDGNNNFWQYYGEATDSPDGGVQGAIPEYIVSGEPYVTSVATTYWSTAAQILTQDLIDYNTWASGVEHFAERDLSDVYLYGGRKYTALQTDLDGTNAPASGGTAYWTDEGVASAADILEYETWTSGTPFHNQGPVTSGVLNETSGWHYIDTWENRPAPYIYFGDSPDSMQKTGYAKSKVWTLQGDRIGLNVGGGANVKEFVALVDAESDRVLFIEYGDAGTDTPNYTMTARLWDITALTGTQVYVCVADMFGRSPNGWISCDTIHEYTMTLGDDDASVPELPIAHADRSLINVALGVEVDGTLTADHAAYAARLDIASSVTATESTISTAELYDAVASKADCKVEECLPLATEMDEWALNALRWLLPLAPVSAVESVAKSVTKANGVSIPEIATDILKVLRVSYTATGDQCRYVKPTEFETIEQAVPDDDYYLGLQSPTGAGYYGKGARVWSDVMGSIKVYRAGASDAISIDYLALPAWSSGSLTIPQGWEGVVALYCAREMRLKQGKPVDTLKKCLEDEMTRLVGFTAAAKSEAD